MTKYFLFINLLIILTISSAFADDPFTFQNPNTNSFMSLTGDYFYIDGEPAESEDQIAVFDSDGIICALFEGSYVDEFTPHGFFSFTVYGDDTKTTEIEGASLSEELSFIVYDASNEIRIPLKNTMINPKDAFGFITPIDSVPPTFKGDNAEYGMEINAQSAAPAPTISVISPDIVFISIGGILSVTGTGFQEGAVITIDSITATNINMVSDSFITCDIPSKESTGIFNVTLINPDGLTATTSLTYEYDPPQITEISPAEVTTEGLTVTIIGEYFRENASMTVNGKAATAKFISETTIQCYIAPYTESFEDTIVNVTLQNDDGKEAASTIKYVVIPNIESIAPTVTTTVGGGQLTILGSNFQATATVLIDNSEPNNISVISNTQITCDIPPHEFGVVDIVVINPNNYSATTTLTYDYPEPTITSIEPQTVVNTGGTELTINGTYFDLSPTVTIDGIPVESTRYSETKIVCNARPYTIPEVYLFNKVALVVTNHNGKSVSDDLTYVYNRPIISDVSPATGTSESLTFTIFGDFFRSEASVKVGNIGVPSKDIKISTNSIICHLTSFEEEQLNITVTNKDEQFVNETFTLIFNPYIESISPQRVHVTGNTPIIITGAHFEEGLTLTINDERITPTTVTENQIEFVAPPYDTETIQSVDLKIINPGDREVMKEGAITYKTLIAKFNIISESQGNAPFIAVLEDASIGDIDEWSWYYGGADPEWRDESDILNIEYTAPGTYPITLHVISEKGEEDTSEISYITVHHYDVDIDFYTTGRIDGKPPLNVKFISEATNAESLDITWTWDFGDGSTSDADSPEYTYTDIGEYTVTLTADIEGIDEPISISKVGFIKVVERQLKGRIVDSDGNGIPGCEIELIVPGKQPIGPITTDPNGNYTFTQLPPEEFIHLAVHPDPQTLFFPTFTEEPLSTISGDTDNIEITLFKGMMVGKIRRDAVGLSGIEISLFDDQGEVGHCLSNAEGDYSLTGLPEGAYRLSAWFEKTGTELFYDDNSMTSNFAESEMITITNAHDKENALVIDLILESGVSIGGKVVDSSGAPVEGILVNAWSEGLMTGGNAMTNSEGLYTITGLTQNAEPVANTENKYIVEIHPDGLPYQAYDNQNNPENANLIIAPNSNINFTIAKGLEIRGEVTVEEGTSENIEICAKSDKEMFENCTLADSSGNYTLSGLKPANDYIVFAHAPDYPVQFYNGVQDIEKASILDLSYEDKENINFAMNKDNRITGFVSGGSFVPDKDVIWVHVWSSATGTGGDVPTDTEGRYEVVGLDPEVNDYIIFVIDPQFGQAYYKDSDTTVYSYQELDFVDGIVQGVGVSDEPRNITLQSSFYSVKGKVTINGQIASGIQVEAWSESKGHWKSCLSASHIDDDGANYELTGLIDGAIYELNINSEKYILSNPRMVTITHDLTNIDLLVTNPNKSISGTITGLSNGSKAWISAFTESVDFVKEVVVEGTGNDVQYIITGLKPAEDYVVHFHALNHPDILYNAKTSWFKANRVNVVKDSKSGIDFTLSTDLGTISGVVTVPSMAEVGEEIWVDAFSESLGSSSATMIKVTQLCNDGPECEYAYTINGLKKGDDYVVVVNSEKYATLFYDNQPNFSNVTLVDNTSGDPGNVNFSITLGYYIDGTIKDSNNAGMSDVEVEAWSESTNSWGSTTTDADGNYKIEGLNDASDFIVQAFITDEPPFIYKKDVNNTRDIDYATKVSSVEMGLTSVDIVIETGYQITGYIQNDYGKGIQGVIVAAEAQTQNLQNHSKTNSSGSFIIKGLPGSTTYNLFVEPGPSSLYMRQEKTVTVDDSNININFTLSTGYLVSGIIRNSSSIPISDAGIFLRSDATGYDEWVVTNADGEYEFNGVPSGTDYDMMVETNEDYLIHIKNDIIVTEDLTENITLQSAAGNIRGYVYNESGAAIPNVMIHLISKDFQRFDVSTNYKGYYEVNGLPDASDYEVIAVPASGSSYASESVTGKSPGDIVNFTLSSGGTISGVVQVSAGTKLEGVLVSLDSASLNIDNELTRTDSDGNYSFEALKSSSASDYIVTVYPTDYGYPVTERTGVNINDTVNFSLTKGSQTTISGTIVDNDSNPPPANTVLVRIYTSNDNVRRGQTFVASDGSFEFTSLDSTKTYVLRFLTQDGTLKHFAKQDGTLNTSTFDTFSTGDPVNVTYNGTWN
jgi:hypothetical protein